MKRNGGFGCYWITDDMLLLGREKADGKLDSIWEYDVSAGRETLRKDVTNAVRGLQYPCGFVFSPDHIWAAMPATVVQKSHGLLVKINTGKRFIVNTTLFNLIWLRDNKHYVLWNFTDGVDTAIKLELYSVDEVGGPKLERTFVSETLSMKSIKTLQLRGDHFIIVGLPSKPKSTKQEAWWQDNSLIVYETGLGLFHFPARMHIVRLPDSKHLVDVALSPRNDWIAMLLREPVTSSIEKAKAIFHSASRNAVKNMTSLWICNLDGSDMHTLGYSISHAIDDKKHSNEGFAYIENLTWLPGGKSISFIGDDMLFCINAN